ERAVAKRLDLVCHDGNYLAPPGSIATGSGGQYKIYTPFWRALKQQMPPPVPLDKPSTIAAPADWPRSDRLAEWGLLPTKPDWSTGFAADWTPGEAGAHDKLSGFKRHAATYDETR
ncbi:deoxyribodipyrimidine photo-lyase, partial [Streptococcus suis]